MSPQISLFLCGWGFQFDIQIGSFVSAYLKAFWKTEKTLGKEKMSDKEQYEKKDKEHYEKIQEQKRKLQLTLSLMVKYYRLSL